jgi:hypothetical protein
MILSGCAHSGVPADTSFAIARDCENLAANVAAPELTVATDPKLAVGEFEVALDEANGNLTATRTCQANQRKRAAGR